MREFTVGNYLATRLEQIGVDRYFVVPGDFHLVLLDRLLENKDIEQIGCCNELNACMPRKPMPGSTGTARSSPR